VNRWKRGLPRFLSHRRFRRSPRPSLRLGEDMSSGLCVCAAHQLCARSKLRALASMGFLTSKSGGLWRVCSRTRAMPLGRFHQRRLSALLDSLRRFVRGDREIASVVLVVAGRASGCPPLCRLLLVGLRSIRPAAIVTDAGCTDPDRAPLASLTEKRDRPTPSSPSTRRTPGRGSLVARKILFLPWDCRVPLLRCAHVHPLPPTPRFLEDSGLDHGYCANHGSRSVPVGSHHFDGLLRGVGSGPVASRYRTWGSLGFREARRHCPKTARTRSTFPPAPHPSKVCSSSVAVPHRWGLLPPDRSDPKRRRAPPDG
jgi:hypothetical protein